MDGGDRSAPLASPVFATLASLSPLLAPEGTHVFQLYLGALDQADEALDEVARFFRRHVGAPARGSASRG